MDFNVLYIFGVIVFVALITIGVIYGKKKGVVDTETLNAISNIFGLSIAIFNELKIKSEKKEVILEIANAVNEALIFATETLKLSSKANIVSSAKSQCYYLLQKLNIEITDNRKLIIDSLIQAVFENKYADNLIN